MDLLSTLKKEDKEKISSIELDRISVPLFTRLRMWTEGGGTMELFIALLNPCIC